LDAAARSERNSDLRETYLIGAGRGYAQAGKMQEASNSLEQAIRDEPDGTQPYVDLTILVLGPRHQLETAQRVIAQGVRAGADAPALYYALARAASANGDLGMTEAALVSSVEVQPTFDALLRLGGLYAEERKYSRAALTYRRATELDPESAEAFFNLGLAEQNDYEFSDAERDLARAVKLAPSSAAYRDHYAEFEHTVAQSVKETKSQNE
jgi:tetratricopeptide (TPR) repeat protein